jgi:cysteine protease ATG4
MIFSIVDEPPSWSDVDDSLESMSEPEEEEEEEDMPEDKDTSSRSGVGDEEVHVVEGEGEEEEEEETKEDFNIEDFFDAGGGAAIDDRVSLRAAPKSGQSEGDTEDDPVGPMTPGPTIGSSPAAHRWRKRYQERLVQSVFKNTYRLHVHGWR